MISHARYLTKVRLFLYGFFTVIFLVSLLPGNATAAEVWKLGNILPDGNILTEEAKFLGKQFSEKTNGEFSIKVYPLTLGNERDITEGLQLGTVDMAQISAGVMSAFCPEAAVFNLPFIFRNWDHLEKVLTSDAARELGDIFLKKTKIRVLGWMEQGFRVTMTSKRPIEKVENFQGLKIRVPEDKVLVRTFELLGAKPTVIPWGEVYTALQTGLVEAMEATPPGIYSMKFYEVTNYLTITNHQHSVVGVLIRESLWKKLKPETQKALQSAVDEMLKLNYKEAPSNSDLMLMKLVMNNKVTYNPDLAPFQKAVESLYGEFGGETGTSDLIAKIRAIK
ncbi:MAG: TRAP transporter substrate-binding protein [Candidatus Hodarchaeota archaeon]